MATAGFDAGHGVDERCAQALVRRAEGEHVETLQHAHRIGPEPTQHDVAFQMLAVNLLLQRFSEFAFAKDHEPGVRDVTDNERRGFDEVMLALLRM